MNEVVREQVHTIARLVPPGRVVSYGDIAGMLLINPRQVGQIMAASRPEDELPWWRITSSYGDLPRHLRDEGFAIWAEEGITVKPNELGCRIKDFRADLAEVANAAEAELGPLPGVSG
ncbi:cysteine methyltransferase [Calidifontibacter sp. DB0510]|uniref:Cysteine methyltransferase n=1 Tax=Metallococcus carri TaxID=1656884 RepID=A0A967B637_9MICO|nr:MGMT family protein [Metallococcus carri]NHN55346.1 cysteine methyltransferase [Metallococcus carri]NOP36423.1 cysteine methyltransferase [Calidifontibacter sp. DB2511S]